jgi:C4-dicarboxylate transporter
MYRHTRKFGLAAAVAAALVTIGIAPTASASGRDGTNSIMTGPSTANMIASADTSNMTPGHDVASAKSGNASSAISPELARSRRLWKRWSRQSEFGH